MRERGIRVNGEVMYVDRSPVGYTAYPYAVGAKGVISVASNLYPKEVSRLVAHALAQDLPKARALHRRLYPVFKAIFIESNPAPIKLAMAEAGIIGSDEVRLPLSPLTPASRQALLATLKAFNR